MVDRIVANDALLRPIGEGLNKICTLFSEVLELAQEVCMVVQYRGLVSGIDFLLVLFLNHLYLLLLDLVLVGV